MLLIFVLLHCLGPFAVAVSEACSRVTSFFGSHQVDEVQALCDGSTPGVSFDGIVTLVSEEGETVTSTSRAPLPVATADDYR